MKKTNKIFIVMNSSKLFENTKKKTESSIPEKKKRKKSIILDKLFTHFYC